MLLYVVVVPLLLYPFLLWVAIAALSVLSAQQERSPVRLTIVPPRPSLSRSLEEKQVITVASADPRGELERGSLDAMLEWNPQNPAEKSVLSYNGRFRSSRRARARLVPLLKSYRQVQLEELALHKGATPQELQPIFWTESNQSSNQESSRYVLGVFLPLCLLVALALGGLYPAVECFAGEHERGTVDTTLGLAVSRAEIVLSKYLMVASLCCLSGACNLVAITVSIRAILRPLSDELADRISWAWSLSATAVVGCGVVVLSMLVAATALLVTAHARSFRQGQSATTPIFMAVLIPAAGLVDPNLSLNWQTCWLPVMNVSLLWRDALTHRVSPGLVAATLLSSLAWVFLCLVLLSWQLGRQSRAIGLTTGTPPPA